MINEKTLVELYNSKITRVLISLYDGPEQLEKFKKLLQKIKIPNDFVYFKRSLVQ